MSLIVVIRSFFRPTSLAGLAAWYDASDPATITASAGAVSQWEDKSGNGRHLAQGTAGARPTTGTRSQNSRNVIDFDGTDDFLAASAGFEMGTSDTVFVVTGNDDGANSTNQTVYNGAGASTTTQYCRLLKTSGNTLQAISGAQLNGGTPDTGPHIITAAFNGTSGSVLRVDGTEVATGSTGTNSAAAAPRIGITPNSDQPWDGWVAEILHYDSVLGASDIAKVEAYLAHKWGL